MGLAPARAPAGPRENAPVATIHLVRHGRVENPKGIIYGRLPGYHLSELGLEQARAAADRLADRDVGAIWASPLERAQETAAVIAAALALEVVTDDRLIESANTLEGATRTVIGILRNPLRWWHFRNPLKPSWGESFSDVKARMLAAVNEAVSAAGGREVVIVSHQTPVLVARFSLGGRRVPPWVGLVPCETGSITSVTLDRGRVVSTSYFSPPQAAAGLQR
jgi:broad specificity phosphatase PhoE